GVAADGRGSCERLSFAGQRSDAAHAGQATAYLCDGGTGGSTERRQPACVRHEQRSGANATEPSRGAQDGANQQDFGWRPPPNDHRERAGIAASVFADIHAHRCHWRDQPLVAGGPKLLQQAAEENELETKRRIHSRQSYASPRRLAASKTTVSMTSNARAQGQPEILRPPCHAHRIGNYLVRALRLRISENGKPAYQRSPHECLTK